jgi:hypothetical protein
LTQPTSRYFEMMSAIPAIATAISATTPQIGSIGRFGGSGWRSASPDGGREMRWFPLGT